MFTIDEVVMAIIKKKDRSVNQKRKVMASSQYMPLALYLIQRLYNVCMDVGADKDEVFDESSFKELLLVSGMPKPLMRSLNILGKKQVNWIFEQVNKINLGSLKAQPFFINLYNLSRQCQNPRLAFRLYLFCYLTFCEHLCKRGFMGFGISRVLNSTSM